MTTGFLRADGSQRDLPRAEPGPAWTFEQADREARRFLDAVVGERPVEHHDDDPVEHARANGLMVLFGAEETEAFDTLLARMPEPRQEAWRDLLEGGASSEAFGPLTLQEQLDERQVEEALQTGRRQRAINLVLAATGVVVVLVGGIVVWRLLADSDERTEGALQFEDVAEEPAVAAVEGGPPVAEEQLVESLSDVLAVEAGTGAAADRVVSPVITDHRQPPGALRATLFQYAAAGHVMVVGPDGFVDDVCLRASVVTSGLRPLDTVSFGDCGTPVGRPATVGCVGPSAVLLALDVPPGEVELPEGGTGFADAVRIQSVTDDERYEVLTTRATIGVPVDSDVVIPRFGGDTGDELTFDLGADRTGVCTLTGDLPS